MKRTPRHLTPLQKSRQHITAALEYLDLVQPQSLARFSKPKLKLAIWELGQILHESKEPKSDSRQRA